jgi:hypothetical protein
VATLDCGLIKKNMLRKKNEIQIIGLISKLNNMIKKNTTTIYKLTKKMKTKKPRKIELTCKFHNHRYKIEIIS